MKPMIWDRSLLSAETKIIWNLKSQFTATSKQCSPIAAVEKVIYFVRGQKQSLLEEISEDFRHMPRSVCVLIPLPIDVLVVLKDARIAC